VAGGVDLGPPWQDLAPPTPDLVVALVVATMVIVNVIVAPSLFPFGGVGVRQADLDPSGLDIVPGSPGPMWRWCSPSHTPWLPPWCHLGPLSLHCVLPHAALQGQQRLHRARGPGISDVMPIVEAMQVLR
jgi:hypothetical protein